MTAIDISDPKAPRPLWTQLGTVVHGLNISDDGNTVYEADLGNSPVGTHTAGLDIVDVHEVQSRVPGGTGHLVAHLSWPDVSLPQVPLPVTPPTTTFTMQLLMDCESVCILWSSTTP